MFRWKRKQSKTDSKTAILNTGIEMVMAFGKHWHVPIDSRLSKQYPSLTASELAEYDQLCQEVLRHAHLVTREMVKGFGPSIELPQFKSAFTIRYPWVSDKNIQSLFKQGLYYVEREQNVERRQTQKHPTFKNYH